MADDTGTGTRTVTGTGTVTGPGTGTGTGYSGTPLVRKLGYQPQMLAVVINPPGSCAAMLGIADGPPVIAAADALPAGLDYLHMFVRRRTDLETVLTAARSAMAPAGMIWVSWPKKSARLATDIAEDTIRAVGLPVGLVDVKVCAVDAFWSGLKLVIRKNLR